MRRNRRGGSQGLEFGGSGEDSFVAVVVTKLTGALLFILLLTMVIMVLIPKAIDVPASPGKANEADAEKRDPLTITTAEGLPEAIAGRPYTLALAAVGGTGTRKWSVQGQLPEGLKFDDTLGQITGTPTKGTPEPSRLVLRVSDGLKSDARPARLVVFESDSPLTLPSRWKPSLPPIPWKSWLDQGVGFLLIWVMHILSMNILRGMEGSASEADSSNASTEEMSFSNRRRYRAYKIAVRLVTSLATLGLAAWLIWPHLVPK